MGCQSGQFNCLLVVVDKRTRFAHFLPLTHPYTAAKVALLYMQQLYKLHGFPGAIVSDRDPLFTIHFWQELFKYAGKELHMSTAHHPAKLNASTNASRHTCDVPFRPVPSVGASGCHSHSSGTTRPTTGDRDDTFQGHVRTRAKTLGNHSDYLLYGVGAAIMVGGTRDHAKRDPATTTSRKATHEEPSGEEAFIPTIPSGRPCLPQAAAIHSDIHRPKSQPQAFLQVLRPLHHHRQGQRCRLQARASSTSDGAPRLPRLSTSSSSTPGTQISDTLPSSREDLAVPMAVLQSRWRQKNGAMREQVQMKWSTEGLGITSADKTALQARFPNAGRRGCQGP